MDDLEASLPLPLPAPYRAFLSSTPASFLAKNDRTLVYGLDSVLERNQTFETHLYCPGHLAIGDDSGGRAIVLSLEEGSISAVDMGAMTPDSFEPIASSFSAWVDAGFPHGG